jgi:mannobiose 2-epimerase
MKNEVKLELIRHIIPFWNSLIDRENGGFFSYMSHDLIINKDTFRSAILHSRILWFYSNCYLTLKNDEREIAEKCLETAKHCYDFMATKFIDRESGGIFWSVNSRGVPANPMKHAYCNAFFVYAAASYYDASGDSTALNNAMRIFEILETTAADKNGIGYFESFDRDWNIIDNDELSENGIQAVKTMNLVLHLIEAYTELYRVNHNEDVAGRIKYLLEIMYYKVYDAQNKQLKVFFDKDWNVLGNVHSYGHDIEASWLLGRTLDIMGEALPDDLADAIREVCKSLVQKIDEVAFCEYGSKSMYYERVNNTVDRRRVWWTQTEGVIGFLQAYNLYGDEKYLQRAQGLWEYIRERMIDTRTGSEWFAELDKEHVPDESAAMADEWKCPYHNGRMAFEVILRDF